MLLYIYIWKRKNIFSLWKTVQLLGEIMENDNIFKRKFYVDNAYGCRTCIYRNILCEHKQFFGYPISEIMGLCSDYVQDVETYPFTLTKQELQNYGWNISKSSLEVKVVVY